MAMVLRSRSSSSSSPSKSNNSPSMSNNTSFGYDVFLSFRGEDTRKTFTDHLYKALQQEGIRTFRDDDAMERGRMLKPELEKVIQESEVSLIVFSKSYATSKWCLDEVSMIMKQHKRKREVVPVFYKIDPTDVRHQTGCFKDAFKGYDNDVKRETDVGKKNELSDKVKAWRASLREAGSLTGMVLSTDGYEADFITTIVKVIRKKLNYNALYIDDKLVGLKNNVDVVESWLQDPSPNAAVFVINGMGGIGKTTIAKCVYNSNFRDYDCSCFLANINDASSKPSGMLRLQSQLLSTALKSEKEETVWNEYEGTSRIKDAIWNKKVLLVLDDVATLEQLETLVGPQRFYPGSKVIITTRNTWLLTSLIVPPKVETISTLSYGDSVELFTLYAFPQNQLIEPYYEQVSQVIHYCEGLPLALKVLGSYLRGRSVDEWEEAMSRLEANPDPGIQKVLQLSFEALEDKNDKDVFLHIACFFVGEDKDFIVKLLAQCNLYPKNGVKNLEDRCLLYVENGKVGMHQLIREMGQEVVHQESPKHPGKRSRLWRHEDCVYVLKENVGTKKVEGLMFDAQNMKEAKKMDNPRKHIFLESNFKVGALEKMMNLMLLQLNYATFSGKYKKLPKKLRLFRWHGFPLGSIPYDIPLEKLVVLDMRYSKLERVWDGYKHIGSLKILDLSYSVELTQTPDFDGLPGLENLILKGCISLTKVDESIADLTELVLLDLTDCRSLRNIPCLPISLVSLQMPGCPNIGAVGDFRCLDPTSFPSLLVKLNISNCNLFDESFPNDWSNLVSLFELKIDGNNVTYLPKCIQSLPKLKRLYASKCSHIQTIQGLPQTLKGLYIENNMSLEKVHVAEDIYVGSHHCPNLCELEGCFKRQPIDKVERRVIEKLGLEMEPGFDYSKQKVLFEYGIFSTCVTEEQIPSGFTYKESGPQISFVVPSHRENRIISGFNLTLVISPRFTGWLGLKIKVYNKTKDLEWIYYPGTIYTYGRKEEKKGVGFGWLSVWRCGNLLHDGDEIFVRIFNYDDDDQELTWEVQDIFFRSFLGSRKRGVCREVEECCIKLIYDDEDQVEEDQRERKEVNDDDETIIRWSDRMGKDLSDYVHASITYSFGRYRFIDHNGGLYSADSHERINGIDSDFGLYSGSYERINEEKREEVAADRSLVAGQQNSDGVSAAQSIERPPTMVIHFTAQLLLLLLAISCFLIWVSSYFKPFKFRI